MFIEQLLNGHQTFYFAVVITMIVSITIHELCHGFAALHFGDTTPVDTGHMTGNPLVHMGPIALACVFLAGFGWGAMPIDPTRMRGKYAHTLVALAGPASNLVLGIASLVLLGLLFRFNLMPAEQIGENLEVLLRVCGAYNLVLAVFNMIPVPPMDGSRILAEFSRGYRDLLDRPEAMGASSAAFLVLFMFGGQVIFPPVFTFSRFLVNLISG
jgi:Zn-dependent protease